MGILFVARKKSYLRINKSIRAIKPPWSGAVGLRLLCRQKGTKSKKANIYEVVINSATILLLKYINSFNKPKTLLRFQVPGMP